MMREFGKSFAEAMAEVAKAGDGENAKEAPATFLENVGFGKLTISKSREKYLVEIRPPRVSSTWRGATSRREWYRAC